MIQTLERLPGWQTQPTRALYSAAKRRARALQLFKNIDGEAQATQFRVAGNHAMHAWFHLYASHRECERCSE